LASEKNVASIFNVKELAMQETKMKQVARGANCLFHVSFLLDLFFSPEDGGNMILQNICSFNFDMTLHPQDRTPHVSR
jgi:hypothetical protein